MIIYFSGGTGKLSAEFLIPSRKPHVMLTFHEMSLHPKWVGWAQDRLKQHVFRKQGRDLSTRLHKAKQKKSLRQDKLARPNTVSKSKKQTIL